MLFWITRNEVRRWAEKRNVKKLIRALKFGGKWGNSVGGFAADELGDIGDQQAVEPLVSLLSRGDSLFRKAVSGALGKIGDSRAGEPLVSALSQRDDSVRHCQTNGNQVEFVILAFP